MMFSICLLVIAGRVLAGNDVKHKALQPKMTEFILDNVAEKPVTSPPPPSPPKPQPAIATIKFLPPKIVHDQPTDVPPVEKLDGITISDDTRDGIRTEDVPPVLENKTTVTGDYKPVHEDNYDVSVPVQIQAQFPGGPDAWRKFLERNLKQDIPVDNGAPVGDYQVVVSFLVDKNGNVTEVKAETDPGYGTAAEAVRVIERSGKWTPAIQNGRNVIYRQKQAITFRVNEQ